ncbi:hypothetical protein ACS0TY_036768 [Phlomoides rotata]
MKKGIHSTFFLYHSTLYLCINFQYFSCNLKLVAPSLSPQTHLEIKKTKQKSRAESTMDMDQEDMQFLGLLGIYKESYKLISACRKIFSQIALSLILPITLIFLAHEQISEIIYWKIYHRNLILDDTPVLTHLSHLVSTDRALFALFNAAYFTPVIAFSLLTNAAVIYTIARFHTSRQTTSFKDVVRVVPRVWKRLIVTFLCAFLAFCSYIAILAAFLNVWSRTIADSTAGDVALVIVFIVYAFGFVYLTIVWQLGSVVSVLEDLYGIKAMMKSVGLIRGKRGIAIALFFELNFVFNVWNLFSVVGVDFNFLGFGGFMLVLSVKTTLFGLVMQTVFYFVCKSYHHENIDKSDLWDRLEGYLGDYYVPLKAKDVQMEEYEQHV